jgi:hypothetical protein
MSEIINQAKEKIAEQLKSIKGGRMEITVSKPVANVLTNFCDDERFALAIVESNETLSSCLKAIMSDVRGSVSDIEVYKRAAEFYFPKATVLFKIEICLDAQEEMERSAENSGNIISLLDFL